MASHTYAVTIRFDCENDVLAACLAHELVMRLHPNQGMALATNPRIYDMESTDPRWRGATPSLRQATTLERDAAYKYVRGPILLDADSAKRT